MWLVMGEYRGEKEEIDHADDKKTARYLAQEYRVAFGTDWRIWIQKEKAGNDA